jgi:aspartate carbamoyltransferase catalytic subunit
LIDERNAQIIFTRKDLLGTRELSPEEITHVLDTAESFREISRREIKKFRPCAGAPLSIFLRAFDAHAHFFEIAAKRLSPTPSMFRARQASQR